MLSCMFKEFQGQSCSFYIVNNTYKGLCFEYIVENWVSDASVYNGMLSSNIEFVLEIVVGE